MGGWLEIWTPSERKAHDAHIRSLVPLTARITKNFGKISANAQRLYALSEEIGKYAAQQSNVDYPAPPGELDFSFPFQVIVRTLSGPRHLLTDEEVAFYRARIKTLDKLMRDTTSEIGKLTGVHSRLHGQLKRIAKLYQRSPKPAKAARKASASPRVGRRKRNR